MDKWQRVCIKDTVLGSYKFIKGRIYKPEYDIVYGEETICIKRCDTNRDMALLTPDEWKSISHNFKNKKQFRNWRLKNIIDEQS